MNKGPVLLFTAHADDCEFFAGGTAARFAAEGRDVYEVIATNNERGTFEMDREALIAASRDREAREAARVLGKREIYFLEYPDGFLGDVRVNELREKFMAFVRRIRPYTVMTFDPFAPYETHPDHRAVAFAAAEAVGFAHLPLYHPEQVREGLAPHITAEVFYFAKHPVNATTIVDIGPYIEKKIEAICAHESQVRMTVEDVRLSLLAVGDDSGLAATLDPGNARSIMDLFVRKWASNVGAKGGVEFGEEFRVERANDLIRGLTE